MATRNSRAMQFDVDFVTSPPELSNSIKRSSLAGLLRQHRRCVQSTSLLHYRCCSLWPIAGKLLAIWTWRGEAQWEVLQRYNNVQWHGNRFKCSATDGTRQPRGPHCRAHPSSSCSLSHLLYTSPASLTARRCSLINARGLLRLHRAAPCSSATHAS